RPCAAIDCPGVRSLPFVPPPGGLGAAAALVQSGTPGDCLEYPSGGDRSVIVWYRPASISNFNDYAGFADCTSPAERASYLAALASAISTFCPARKAATLTPMICSSPDSPERISISSSVRIPVSIGVAATTPSASIVRQIDFPSATMTAVLGK